MTYQVPEKARQEIKFVCYEVNYALLMHWLRMHPAVFSSPYGDRWINNVYFDTFDCAAYSENLSGASARTKIRYRWYGKSISGPDAGTLEIKQKRNMFGWKLRYKVETPPYTDGRNWREVRACMLDQLPLDGRKWLDANPCPVLINRYHRKYFLSADKKIRITIDDKQAVWDQRFKPYLNFKNKANLPNTMIVEVKFDRNDRTLATHVLQGIPIRVSRHSKYMTGMMAITGI